MIKNCFICSNKKHRLVWNSQLRSGQFTFTKKKFRLLECTNCNLVSLEKFNKHLNLENTSVARKYFNKSNSFKDYINFNYDRELDRLRFLRKFINFDKKSTLESNGGTGIILEFLKKKAKSTSILENEFYKDFYYKSGHSFFSNISDIKKSAKKFDIILSLSELEHKYEPKKFLKNISSILSPKGYLVLRVPNYSNIYAHLLGKDYFKYDYRTSHNYYFSTKNLRLLFEKLNFKIIKELGFHEYSINHLIEFMKTKKRVYKKNLKSYIKPNQNKQLIKIINNNKLSTSLIYILKQH